MGGAGGWAPALPQLLFLSPASPWSVGAQTTQWRPWPSGQALHSLSVLFCSLLFLLTPLSSSPLLSLHSFLTSGLVPPPGWSWCLCLGEQCLFLSCQWGWGWGVTNRGFVSVCLSPPPLCSAVPPLRPPTRC